MDNQDKMATLDTKDIGRRQTKQQQKHKTENQQRWTTRTKNLGLSPGGVVK